MFKPKNLNAHKELLSSELLQEKDWLHGNYQVFARPLTEEYLKRAQVFNAECRKIGATLMCVVEK